MTLLLASVLAFTLFKLVPGDAATAQLGVDATPEAIAAFREKLGLNEPSPLQYIHWLGRTLSGDLGRSVSSNEPVWDLIRSNATPTVLLALGSLLVSLPVGVLLGIVGASRANSILDRLVSLVAMFGISIPNFWLALLLISSFALTLRWLPAAGYVSWSEDPLGLLRSLILPTLTQAAGLSAIFARTVRGSMLEVLGGDYVRTAKSKGLRDGTILYRHVLKNAMNPVVSVVALRIGQLLGGVIITEVIFAIPGLGNLLITSIQRRDFPTAQALVVLSAATFVVVNLVADLTYPIFNPRILRR
jgi:peptide/nickel transport system permease protein